MKSVMSNAANAKCEFILLSCNAGMFLDRMKVHMLRELLESAAPVDNEARRQLLCLPLCSDVR